MKRLVLGWIWEMLISMMTLRIPACATGWGGVKFTGDIISRIWRGDLLLILGVMILDLCVVQVEAP